jgi:nitrate/nitrite transporter NarK
LNCFRRPPRTWFLPNFAVLFGAALLPYFWWTAIFTIFTVLWQSVYGWSAISMAVHTLPIGIPAFAVSFTGGLSAKGRIQPKWLILGGQVLVLIATVLLIFADRPERYWPIVFPAFILGTTGAMFAYTHNNIAIFRTAPASMSGVIGALFNGALQLGSALGIAAITSIQTSVEVRAPGGYEEGFKGFEGRRAAFYFLLAVVAVEVVAVAVFYRLSKVMSVDVENVNEQKRESVVNEKSI